MLKDFLLSKDSSIFLLYFIFLLQISIILIYKIIVSQSFLSFYLFYKPVLIQYFIKLKKFLFSWLINTLCFCIQISLLECTLFLYYIKKMKKKTTTKNKEKKKRQFSIMIFASYTSIVTNKRQVHILSYSFVFLCFHTNTNFHFFFAFSCNNRSVFTIKHVALKFVNFPNIGKNWEFQAFFKVKSICQLIK